MERILTPLFCLLSSILLSAQSKAVFYYDLNWKITTAQNFQYRRDASFDFNKIRFNGIFKDFDTEGHLIGEGAYSNGKKTGNFKTYSTDGSILSSIDWRDDDFTIIELQSTTPEFSVTKGTGKFKFKYSFASSNIHGTLTGEFKENKRVGKWLYTDSTGELLFEEVYSRGEFKRALIHQKPDAVELLMKKAILDKGGLVTPIETTSPVNKLVIKVEPHNMTDFLEFDRSKLKNLFSMISQAPNYCNPELSTGVRFVGGDSSLSTTVAKSIHYPPTARRNNIEGQVIIKVTIDADGSAKNYSILKSSDSTKLLNPEALRVAKTLEERWFPAQKNCQSYESFTIVPIAFRILSTVNSK